jgi:hypothetical protein
MASSGHAFIAHTKALSPRVQPKDGGYGLPPHPRNVRSGQLYWPRVGRRRSVLSVRRVTGARVLLSATDRQSETARPTLARLLATRDDGQGRYYQFQGFSPRLYETQAYIWSLDERSAVLCVPEWHPSRPVRLPAQLLPVGARCAGAWLYVRCDLSASSAARLRFSALGPAPKPRSGSLHPPDLSQTEEWGDGDPSRRCPRAA